MTTDPHSPFSILNSPLIPPGYKQTEVGVINGHAVEPGGFSAISRGLRSNATTPPESNDKRDRIPEGCQRWTT